MFFLTTISESCCDLVEWELNVYDEINAYTYRLKFIGW